MEKRVALITGGAKGIGREIGLRLGERGWWVALCYRTSSAARKWNFKSILLTTYRQFPVTPDNCSRQ